MKLQQITIREAKKSDINQIAKIFYDNYTKSPYNEKWTLTSAVSKINLDFNDYTTMIFVAVYSKEIIGFIIVSDYLWDEGLRGYISELHINSKYQGHGVGEKLLNKAESILKKKKIKTVVLFVNKKSTAYRIYKKYNYKNTNLILLKKSI